MTHAILNDRLLGAALGLLSLVATQTWAATQLPPPLQPDVSDTATLPPQGPHRFFTSNPDKATFVIFDADTCRMEGSFQSRWPQLQSTAWPPPAMARNRPRRTEPPYSPGIAPYATNPRQPDWPASIRASLDASGISAASLRGEPISSMSSHMAWWAW